MASFPSSIYSPRTMVNRLGVIYDALKTKVIYAEDINNDRAEIVAIETVLLNGGWLPISTIPTLQASDNPVYTLRFGADMTAIIGLGNRIKLTQHGSVKYFIVVKVGAYTGGNTDIDVYGGTDYDMENTGTYPVTLPNFSIAKAPFGFPLDSAKWTETATDTSDRTQSNPTQNQWYNLGSFSLSIPIGAWEVSYKVFGRHSKATTTAALFCTTLSTANNSESDADFTNFFGFAAGSATLSTYITSRCSKKLVLASKTSYYLNGKTNQAATSLDITFYNSTYTPAVIKAVCAYL